MTSAQMSPASSPKRDVTEDRIRREVLEELRALTDGWQALFHSAIGRFEVAAAIGGDAVWNPVGAKAMAKLLKEISRAVDASQRLVEGDLRRSPAHDAALDEISRLRTTLLEQSTPCTCHEAYSGRRLQDPDCRAGEYGDDCRAAIGLPPLCQHNIRLARGSKMSKEG